MGRGAFISILGLYRKDATIFNNMALPFRIQLRKQELINKLLMDCAELEILYPSTDMMKEAIEYWSKAHVHSWELYYETLDKADYDPFTDFDRHEDFTEHYSDDRDTQSDSRTSERAYNDAELTDIANLNNTAINSASGSRDHTLHQYGNSALGTNQDIIKKEIELRKEYNVIDLIINQFKKDFCLLVY